MTNLIISGIFGHMGRTVLELAQADKEFCVLAGVDMKNGETAGVPVYDGFDKISAAADAVVDFSAAANLYNVLSYCERTGAAAILCATGYSEEDLKTIERASGKIPLFKTANLSVGVNLLQKLVKEAAAFLGENFDVEIIEKHHNLKKDAPSGTAYMLAESVNEAFDGNKKYVYGRVGMTGARDRRELGIHAVRGGTIVGEHEVMFAGEDEIVTLSHSARSKRVFAAGALKAASFMKGKPAGRYDMKNVIDGMKK